MLMFNDINWLLITGFRTHRYNYDHVEISGEESMEEFIKDTDSPDSPDSNVSTNETNTKVSVLM